MIITGSNAPIIFRMPEPIESIKGFSILLCKYDAELKSWTDDDLTFVDNMVIAPLSQDETMEFPLGACTIHLKWLAENGVVKFNKTIDSYIHKHPDKNILGDGAGTVTYTEGVVYDVDTRTDTIVVRGYSPYVNDNGTWEYFDDVKKQYVDTGIVAQGKDGYTPRKGVDYVDGTDGEDGVGIKEVRQIKASTIPGDWNAFEIELTNGKIYPFKIQNGLPGKDGEDGRDGYTPQKGVDYFDGKNGKDGADGLPGADGKDGVGIVSMRQTSSTVLPAGNNVFTFYTSDGKAASFVVYNGRNYQITESDYARIASMVEDRMYEKGYVTESWVQNKLNEIWDYIREHEKEGS